MELSEAEMIMGLCRELHCLPSQLMAEDVSILRLMAIETMGRADG